MFALKNTASFDRNVFLQFVKKLDKIKKWSRNVFFYKQNSCAFKYISSSIKLAPNILFYWSFLHITWYIGRDSRTLKIHRVFALVWNKEERVREYRITIHYTFKTALARQTCLPDGRAESSPRFSSQRGVTPHKLTIASRLSRAIRTGTILQKSVWSRRLWSALLRKQDYHSFVTARRR